MIKLSVQTTSDLPLEAQQSVILMNISGLNPVLRKQITEYYNKKLDDSYGLVHYNYIRKIAFYKTIEYGFLGLFIYDVIHKKFLINEGFFHNHTDRLIQNYIHQLNAKHPAATYPVYIDEALFELELRLLNPKSTNYLFGVIAPGMSSLSGPVHNLVNIFTGYFGQEFANDRVLCEYNYLPGLNKHLKNLCNDYTAMGKNIHYVLIETESLAKYIKVAGDYLVNEIIKNVQNEIDSIIQGAGKCFTLNSRQYLIVITDENEDSIKKKFGKAHFRVKNLLLVYQMNYIPVSDIENGTALEKAWPFIKIQ
ncbi:MAG: hypothetical protein OEV66_11085 [Spirochaetia bacterium]|nr:hypothetical protein [Spirochaetia bacterium]